MPPEYLTRAEADKRFRDLEASMNIMAVDNATRDGEVKATNEGLARIEAMLKDKSQQWLTMAVLIFNALITIGVAVWAKSP